MCCFDLKEGKSMFALLIHKIISQNCSFSHVKRIEGCNFAFQTAVEEIQMQVKRQCFVIADKGHDIFSHAQFINPSKIPSLLWFARIIYLATFRTFAKHYFM